jgi:SEFIR domain
VAVTKTLLSKFKRKLFLVAWSRVAALQNSAMATVFISYRHESDAGVVHVRRLAERLEQANLTVVLDQFVQEREFNGGGPNQGWPRWSKAQARNMAHKILIVASPGWFRCYEGTEACGVGLGACAEAIAIEQRLYNASGVNPDIRIVAFDPLDRTTIPLDLQPYHCFLYPRDCDDLIRWLTGVSIEVPVAADWPESAPSLSWAMADHSGVRDVFAQLITRNAPFHYLPIRGPSEAGKSQITKQLLGNALRCPGLACGRFDFKGTTDVDAEVQRFVQHLGVPVPSVMGSLTQRLTAVLKDLNAQPQPTLLIFDTFEMAGSAEQWVQENLLVTLIRAPLLRVVIAGQRVPEPGGAPWDTEARSAIVLNTPAPEDWFDYGRPYKPGITIEFVRQAHTFCGGRASVLAQLLGPAR